ncbi:MAG: hypothetical protein ACE37J_13990 [Pikeienuella sp.]|uniref:hypothetical protein n=1 Tax=Pikeienuella sp. TaxID=2831957 RepID=UPI003918FC97
MSLDPELKAEIERRVAAGEVTRCPPRTFARDVTQPGDWKDGRDAAARAAQRQRRFQAAEAKRRRLEAAGAALGKAAKDSGTGSVVPHNDAKPGSAFPEETPCPQRFASKAREGAEGPEVPATGGRREPPATRRPAPRPEKDRHPAPETTPARGLSEVWPFRAHRAVAEIPEAASPAGLRPVAPVSDRNLKPRAPGKRPALRWIPLARLAVSEAYQRGMAARSVTMIRKAVEAFDWARLKPLSVAARADGWFEVLDGQHTATILLMAGETEAPCLVLPDAAEAEKAEAFVGLNSSRVQVTPMQRHHAAVAAGRPVALAVEAACRAAGANLLRNAKPAGRYLPGETVAAPALTSIAGRRGEAGLTRVLAPLVAAGLAPIPTDALLAVELLLFDPGWAGEIGEAAITRALGDLPARLAEAETLRARAPQPRPRALAAAIFIASGR